MIDGGLKVYYNGKINSVFFPPDWDIDYEIGEMLLELYESRVSRVSETVTEYLHREKEPIEENLIDAIEVIFSMDSELDAAVEWSMAKSSFVNSAWIFIGALMEEKDEANKIHSVGEFLDACIEEYAAELDGFKLFFEAIVARDNGDESDEVKSVIKSLEEIFAQNHKIQSIGYELIFDKKVQEFMSVYTVSNMMSLLALEYSHMVENNRHIRKCKNCGGYFLPKNRSDTVYCDRISPQDSLKSCRQVGAQIAMQNKLASDECIQTYRKKYQALNMAYQRAVGSEIQAYSYKKRERFKEEGQKRKKMLSNGEITIEVFLKWCENYT